MGASKNYVSADLVAQNTFTDPLNVGAGDRASVRVDIGTATTATLQRRYFNTIDRTSVTAWADVEGWSVDAAASYVADESGQIRIGVKTGAYGSGTTSVRLGVG